MEQEEEYVEVSPPPSPRIWQPIPGMPGSYQLAELRCCYCGRTVHIPSSKLVNVNAVVCANCEAGYDAKQRKITEFFVAQSPTR